MSQPVIPGKQRSEGVVLVVDDEPSLAKATSRLLRAMGFEAAVATDCRQAVEICRTRAGEIRLVLLDLFLWETDCRETLRQMRAVHPEIRVILMSGHDKRESAADVAAMRLEGFLPKPFGYAELENAVHAAFDAGRAQEQQNSMNPPES
jgi:DNA-binding NtrC family response regulator